MIILSHFGPLLKQAPSFVAAGKLVKNGSILGKLKKLAQS
jgi:hypothetical protein